MRAALDALKWHTANIKGGESFIVPTDKIYEVYVYLPAANYLDLNTIRLCVGMNAWQPKTFNQSFDSTDTPYIQFSTLPHGWILSDGDKLETAADFIVRWRDVTEQQLGY